MTAVVFTVSDAIYALPRSAVQEILLMPALSRPPGLPSMVEGFLQCGGLVPVVRLDRLFELAEHAPGLYSHLLLLTPSPFPLALLVDRVREILSVPRAAVVPLREDQVLNGCVTAHLQLGEGAIPLLSLEHLLLAEERERLASLREAAARRVRELEAGAA
jgi:purine-binding chemotaxis protein CheW